LAALHTDRFNRQVHLIEIELIKRNAADFAREAGIKDGNGELDVAAAEKQLTQAFLAEADIAWEQAYARQDIEITDAAQNYIAQLRDETESVGGFRPFHIAEGDRENRLLYSATIVDNFSFYRDNAATEQGKSLLGLGRFNNQTYKDGVAVGEAEGLIDAMAARGETNQAIANIAENPGSTLVQVVEGVIDTITNPSQAIKDIKQKVDAEELAKEQLDVLHILELLEGGAFEAGKLQGAENVVTQESLTNEVAAIVLGGRVTQVLDGGKSDVGTTQGRSVVSDKINPQHLDLVTSHPNAHAMSVHGGSVTDVQLIHRAQTGVKPNGDVGGIPKISTAFHSDEALVFADQAVRNNGGLQAAIARNPGETAIRVTVDDVGDLGVDLGRGFERLYKTGNKTGNANMVGAPARVDNLTSVEGFYMLNQNTNVWETISIFPAPKS